jgi:hypothetical protein
MAWTRYGGRWGSAGALGLLAGSLHGRPMHRPSVARQHMPRLARGRDGARWRAAPRCAPGLAAAALSSCTLPPPWPVSQLNELEGSCDKAQSDFARFKLTSDEINSRRKWISSTRRQVRASSCAGSTRHRLPPPLPPVSTSTQAAARPPQMQRPRPPGACCPQIEGMAETLKTATAAPPVSAHESKVSGPTSAAPRGIAGRGRAVRQRPWGPPCGPPLACLPPGAAPELPAACAAMRAARLAAWTAAGCQGPPDAARAPPLTPIPQRLRSWPPTTSSSRASMSSSS